MSQSRRDVLGAGVSEERHAIVENAAFVVDADGRKSAVILDLSSWRKLLNFLVDIEDSAEIEASRLSGNEPIPWQEAKVKLRVKGINI